MGKKIEDAEVKKECPSCGLGVALDSTICEFCGWDFEEEDDYVIIKPRRFLGSDNFSKIASAVRGMGGDYISAGKASKPTSTNSTFSMSPPSQAISCPKIGRSMGSPYEA